jgi:hypothetical protein
VSKSLIPVTAAFDADQYPNLDRLNLVPAAAHDSYETSRQRTSCFEGTRARLLDDTMSWINSEKQTQPIYILYGIAGIGKSTVAKTLAERTAKYKVLGASFFFSRDEDNRKTAKWFFSVLAYHLARYDEDCARCINHALQLDPDAAGRDIRAQCDSLIAKPLQHVMKKGKPVLIVIDALDECDEDGAEAILTLLAHNIPQMPRLRVFITARPEQHLQAALDEYRDHKQFHMQDIEQSVVEADIQLYLSFRLSEKEVRKALPRLRPPPWQPTEEQMRMLVGMSGKLFIIASTAADFILKSKHVAPAKRIATLLDGVSPKDFSGSKQPLMDDIYTRIIRAAQPDPIDDWIHQFQTFVGAIVVLQDPLPCDVLAQLLDVDVNDIIGTLSNLHSFLAPSEMDQTYRVHHKSFPDFICDRDRCKKHIGSEFYIDPALHHMRIAERCLRIMDHNLKFNICDLDNTEQHKDRDQLDDRVRDSISPHLAYACAYWASHLVGGLDSDVGLNSEVNEFLEQFATRHLLHWLEVLSIIGRADIAYSSLEIIHTAMVRVIFTRLVSKTARNIYMRT